MKLKKGDNLNHLSFFFYDKIKKEYRKKKTKQLFIIDNLIINDKILKFEDKKIMENISKYESEATTIFIVECLKRKIQLFTMTLIFRKHSNIETLKTIKTLKEKLEKGEEINLFDILSKFGNIFIYALICINDQEKKIENILDFIIEDNSFYAYNF